MQLIAILVLVIVLFLLALPFILSSKLPLSEAIAVNSIDKVKDMRQQIIERYLEEEAALTKGDINKKEWLGRKKFLVNRFVDLSRRLDYLKSRPNNSTSGESQ